MAAARRFVIIVGQTSVRTVYVFVSSPSDAADERKRLVRLVERLNVDFSDVAELRPVLWEDRAYEAHEGFQEQIRASTDCDVVIAVLRGRVGTPLAPDFIARVPPEDRLGIGVRSHLGVRIWKYFRQYPSIVRISSGNILTIDGLRRRPLAVRI